MDAQTQFCPNPNCHARGKVGEGNIVVHSKKEKRYRCKVCSETFSATKGTPFYRLRTSADVVTLVMTLLANGCPVQAIVTAFGFDERTVYRWLKACGVHCKKVHEHIVCQSQVELRHVQADEIWVKMVLRRVFMAMAISVPSRLWLGGVISVRRDMALISALANMIRSCAYGLGILVCVDGLSSYVKAFKKAFRQRVLTGQRGRPRLVLDQGFMLGQVIKRYAKGRVVSVSRRVVIGTISLISSFLRETMGGKMINIAFIERLNSTFRSRLFALVRRSRAILRREGMLTAWMYLVGCFYNFCCYHEGLRLRCDEGSSVKWYERTPAMAAGLSEYRWTMMELLWFKIPLSVWVAPKRRGRKPKMEKQPALEVVI